MNSATISDWLDMNDLHMILYTNVHYYVLEIVQVPQKWASVIPKAESSTKTYIMTHAQFGGWGGGGGSVTHLHLKERINNATW